MSNELVEPVSLMLGAIVLAFVMTLQLERQR